MERFILLTLICGAVALVTVSFLFIRAPRHLESAVEMVPVPLRSVVHVLRTQDELEAAVRRAADFERRTTDERRSRADRYDAMLATRAIAHSVGERDEQPERLLDDHV